MAKIRVMDPALASKVAAGEVITRPLNAVKELIENSLDAGAKSVQIDLQQGGKRLISVSDDGCGMSADDLKLSIQSHATSKISKLEDFLSLLSFGFRGEALASVAAVSKLSIESCEPSQSATSMQVVAGKIQGFGLSTRSKGTRVEIRELFYNIPARLKFLKSDNYEKSLVVDLVQSFMATHSEVGFQLTHNDQRVLVSSGQGSYSEILAALFGAREARGMIEVPVKKHPILGIRLHAYLSPSTVYRSNSKDLRLFINRRIIKHPPILKAVQSAYENLSSMRKWPMGLIFLEIPPAMLDVNVHPMKLELRIENEPLILEFLAKSLRSALLERSTVPRLISDFGSTLGASSFTAKQSGSAEKNSTQSGLKDFFVNDSVSVVPKSEILQDPSLSSEMQKSDEFKQRNTLIPSIEINKVAACPAEMKAPILEVKIESSSGIFPSDIQRMRVIGQLKQTFILAEYDDSLVVIDQHVAQERILFETFYESLKSGSGSRSRKLLIPVNYKLSSAQSLIIEARGSLMRELGFEFTNETERLIINAVPLGLPGELENCFVEELIASLEDSSGITRLEERYKEIAESMACKGSVRAGDTLGFKEMEVLLRDLSKCENPFHCPHGRPVLVEMPHTEIYKKFDRVFKRQL